MKRQSLNFAVLFSLSLVTMACRTDPDSDKNELNTCLASFRAEVGATSVGLLNAYSAANDGLAQSFQTPIAARISSVSLNLYKASALNSGTIRLTLQPDTWSNLPSGSPIDGSYGQLDVQRIGPNAGFVEIKLNKPVMLEANTSYWLVLDGTYSSGDKNLVYWVGKTGNLYNKGAAAYQHTGVWKLDSFASGLDLSFKLGCI